MTLALSTTGRGIQRVGLAMALAGAGMTLIAPFCASESWTGAAIIGAFFDVAALASRNRWSAIALCGLKLVIVVAPIAVLVMCAPVVLPTPSIPTDLGPNLIMLSGAVSLIGAILRGSPR